MSPKFVALFSTFISNFVTLLILALCIKILPNSPFQAILDQYGTFSELPKYLQLFYYFVPVDRLIAVLNMWIVCILNYFVFRFFLNTAYNSSGGGLIKL